MGVWVGQSMDAAFGTTLLVNILIGKMMNIKTATLKSRIIFAVTLSILLLFVYFVFNESSITIGSSLIIFALIAIAMEAAERVLFSGQLSWLSWIQSADYRACVVRFSFLGAASFGAWEVALITPSILWYSVAGITAASALLNLIAVFRAA